MAFKKGEGGRPSGAVNKLNRSFKEALRIAFDSIGGPAHLTAWARENQTDFYKIMARLIPVEVNASVNHVVQANELSDDELASIAAGRSRAAIAAPEGKGKPH